MTTERHEPTRSCSASRARCAPAGLAITHDRATSFLQAASMVGAGDPHATYRAGRATLCAGPDDLVRYAHVFEAWFGVREQLPRTVATGPAPRDQPAAADGGARRAGRRGRAPT